MRTKSFMLIASILLVLSIPPTFYLLRRGFYEPHDLHHFADIYEMVRALASGQIPPRWGPDFSFNFGYPLFNFYYVLPFYLAALTFFISGSVITAFKSVFLVSIILSVFAMYFLLREFTSKWSSMVGSILFLYTPYRAVQIYVRGAMGEALALSLIPLVAWGIVRLVKNPKNLKLVTGVSLIVTLFILSHNYLWALTIPWLVLLPFIVVDIKRIKKSFIPLLGVVLLSLGISAYWWLPALMEQKLITPTTPFPLIDHFPFVRQLIIPSWGYGSSVWGPGDGMSFQIGVVNLGVFILFSLILIFKRNLLKDKKIFKISLWAFVGFLANFLLMNIRTYPLWRIIPFHDFIQFPWRLLIFTTFFTGCMSAILVEALGKKGKLAGSLIILGSIILTFNYFRPSKIYYTSDNDYLSRFFADRTLTGSKNTISQSYLEYSEDYLLLPKWTEKRPSGLPSEKIESDAADVINIQEINPIHWKADLITKNKIAKIKFNSYYFPGWYTRLDGRIIDTTFAEPNGQLEFEVPQGKHTVEIYWKETPLRKFADYLSVISLICALAIIWKNYKRNEAS